METTVVNEIQPPGVSSSSTVADENREPHPKFGLLTAEEEDNLSRDVSVSSANQRGRPGNSSESKGMSLRSVSLPKGPKPSSSDAPIIRSATSTANVDASSRSLLGNLTDAKKPKKVVSDYYKKQNTLLENFKNDSEQIQVFQKTRTRQRLQSSTSTQGAPEPEVASSVKAPLLMNVEGDNDMHILERSEKNGTCSNISMMGSSRESLRSSDAMIAKRVAQEENAAETSKAASRLAFITLFVNVSLMVIKAVASYLSGSLSIISSLVDSCVDITSGLVISMSTRMIRKRDPYLYPRGRTRLEPLSLMIISVVMGVASCQLIFDAISRIYTAYSFEAFGTGEMPKLAMDWTTVGIMISTVVVKFTLFLVCQKHKSDPSIEVLAMDHRNDCISNSVALLCAFLAKRYWYYLDPIGAIIVSLYILFTWVRAGKEHLSKLSGKTAEPEFINRIIKVCIDHDQRISHLDTVYVYHYGTKFLVEVHIVLDRNMLLKVAHDISESLQINIESLPEVERAFVHTDYEYDHQPGDEHKVV